MTVEDMTEAEMVIEDGTPAVTREYIRKLHDLVRWLSMPYANGRPIFATALPNGTVLDAGVQLQALWDEVTGYQESEGLTMNAGAWSVCPHCGSRTVSNVVQ